jgi:deoxyribodipyrimidine photolyase
VRRFNGVVTMTDFSAGVLGYRLSMVDAGMRQLNETVICKWCMVCSFLCKHLLINGSGVKPILPKITGL